jgi:hypothetical protein
MKQIGVRQEAARLGGIGSCGRELCCSTWLTDFRSVSTASARYQQLSLNPEKLAGQCGKLKCCLNYELDSYLDALKKFPRSDIRLKTEKGFAFHIKTDVFKELMWYIQEDKTSGGGSSFIPLMPDRVAEIIRMNKAGEIPNDLKDFMIKEEVVIPDYTDVVGQDDLNRFEHVFKKSKNKKNKNKPSVPQNNANPNQADRPKPVAQQNNVNPGQTSRPKPANPNNPNKPQNNRTAEGVKPQENQHKLPNNKPPLTTADVKSTSPAIVEGGTLEKPTPNKNRNKNKNRNRNRKKQNPNASGTENSAPSEGTN